MNKNFLIGLGLLGVGGYFFLTRNASAENQSFSGGSGGYQIIPFNVNEPSANVPSSNPLNVSFPSSDFSTVSTSNDTVNSKKTKYIGENKATLIKDSSGKTKGVTDYSIGQSRLATPQETLTGTAIPQLFANPSSKKYTSYDLLGVGKNPLFK